MKPFSSFFIVSCVVVSLSLLILRSGWATPIPSGAMDISVTVPPTKADGHPWDGNEGIYAQVPFAPWIMGPITPASPPELWLVLVDMQANAQFFSGRFKQGSLKDDFRGVSMPSGQPFGLIILDKDLHYHDLVDAVIVVPRGHSLMPDEGDRLNRVLHTTVDHWVNRPDSRGSVSHALRQPFPTEISEEFPVVQQADCKRDTPCLIDQATIFFGR